MKKTVLTYGIIAGVIVSVWILITMGLGVDQMNGSLAMLLGYTAMIVSFAFIFVAVRKYRSQYGGGGITFGKAFMIGLYISLIASTFYVVTWLIDYYCFIPDFMEKYATSTIEHLKASGASVAKIAETTKQMDSYREMYKNPIFVVLLTYMEILPVGLVVSLITAAILRRKPNPAM